MGISPSRNAALLRIVTFWALLFHTRESSGVSCFLRIAKAKIDAILIGIDRPQAYAFGRWVISGAIRVPWALVAPAFVTI
jgi:hypothetical protein